MKILYNARIYTFDQLRPRASVLVIDRDRIAAVGGPELLDAFGTRVSREDMGGRVILPGLTDAHIHLQHYALSLQKVDCETPTRAECLRRVAERARQTPPNVWILGHGWQQNDWPEGFGNAALLDEVAPHHPVYLTAKSLHAGWANTAALRLAGITPDTPDPRNGQIVRDAHGQPTGILLESAMDLVARVVPHPSIAQIADAIERTQPALFRMGLTGVHDFDYRDAFMALQYLHSKGGLKLRVIKNLPGDLYPHALAMGLRSGFGDDTLRIGAVKVFMDGALGPRTAAMFEPYLNEPDNRGILNMDGEALFEIAYQAADAGLTMTVHAIGDRANHEVLNAYEQLRRYETERGYPPRRHRIEHVQILHPRDADRLARLNVIASMQPIHATSDMLAADRLWGARARLAYAWRTQLDAGAVLAFGSDAPVESPNPFWGLYAAVTRRRADGTPGPDGWYPQERLDMQAALQAYTLGAAYAAGMEDRLGHLTPGCLADLIVLEKDLFTCPPEDLLTLESSATMVGGAWVWQS